MTEQLELFTDESPYLFAVIFCSCLMEDQFGNTWYRRELYKSNLSEDATKNLTASLNQSLYSADTFYEVVPVVGPNFLIP